MEITRRDIIIILSAIPMAFIIAFVVVLTAPSEHKPVVHSPEQVVDSASTSTYIVTTTTVALKSAPVVAKPVRRAVPSTTSTSEVPPPLTPEQEAKIPGPEVESDPDADEHLPAGTDYDLPYATVDIRESAQ